MENQDSNHTVMLGFSVCTINGNLNVYGSFKLLKGLLSIFQSDESGQLLVIQKADVVFFQKLHAVSEEIIAADPPRSGGLIKFLEKIKINEKFVLTSGNVNADRSLNNYVSIKQKVYQLNEMHYPIDLGKIGKNYILSSFGDVEAYIGESDKKKRTCRFCGGKIPGVKFDDEAHAISESLGNKLLYCNEECDRCNHKRFVRIEQDFINAHLILYSLHRKKGKKGILNVGGKNITIDNKKTDGFIEIKTDADFTTVKENGILDFTIQEPRLKFAPQNVYKCLCKFAVSVIDKKHLKRLSETIYWLGSDCTKTKLPPIWFMITYEMYDQPQIRIFIKKETANMILPDFVVQLNILNIQYLYIFPFVDDKEFMLSESSKSAMENLFGLSKYFEIASSLDNKLPLVLRFNIINQEGAEIMTIGKSEFDSLSDKELQAKYPNVSGFLINNNA